jgi:hypothetical protein
MCDRSDVMLCETRVTCDVATIIHVVSRSGWKTNDYE